MPPDDKPRICRGSCRRLRWISALFAMQFCLTMQACTTVGSVDRPQSYYQDNTSKDEGGLLSNPTLGDENKQIIELLNYRIKLPKQNRIAILKLSKDNYWRFYSNDFTELNDSLVNELVTKLRNSKRVYDASFLPAMLVSEKRTISLLREAAARFQADLLLAYRSACNSYQKYRFISSNQTKSYCSVEAVLLDVRSGIVAKSVVSTEEFSSEKNDSDTNFAETVKRAELQAVAKALGKVANEIVSYLDNVPIQ